MAESSLELESESESESESELLLLLLFFFSGAGAAFSESDEELVSSLELVSLVSLLVLLSLLELMARLFLPPCLGVSSSRERFPLCSKKQGLAERERMPRSAVATCQKPVVLSIHLP